MRVTAKEKLKYLLSKASSLCVIHSLYDRLTMSPVMQALKNFFPALAIEISHKMSHHASACQIVTVGAS